MSQETTAMSQETKVLLDPFLGMRIVERDNKIFFERDPETFRKVNDSWKPKCLDITLNFNKKDLELWKRVQPSRLSILWDIAMVEEEESS